MATSPLLNPTNFPALTICIARTQIVRTVRTCAQQRNSGRKNKKAESVPTLNGSPMENEHERWRTLCELAANEQDLERLLQLVRESIGS
jgi:hypothetical protein